MRLTNTGNGVLEFFSACSHSQDSHSCEIALDGKWLCVQPKSGAIDPGMFIDLTIKYFPRITGEFNVVFLLEAFYFSNFRFNLNPSRF